MAPTHNSGLMAENRYDEASAVTLYTDKGCKWVKL